MKDRLSFRIRLGLVAFICAISSVFVSGQGDPTRPAIVLQTGHRAQIRGVAVSPDGKWIATGSLDSTLKIWDAESGQERRSINAQSGAVQAIALDPKGKTLVSAGIDGRLRTWNVESGIEGPKYEGIAGLIEVLAFSSDGKMLAAAGSEKKVWIFDTGTRRLVSTVEGHTATVAAIAFSPDGTLIASGGADKIIRISTVSTGKRVRELKDHTDPITALRFDATGTMLASGGQDNTVRLWRLPKGDPAGVLSGHSSPIVGLAFSAKGLLSADRSGLIKTWDIAARKELSTTPPDPDIDNLGKVRTAGFAQDGSFAVFGHDGDTGTIANTNTGARPVRLGSQTTGSYGTAFSSDRRLMAAAGFDNTIKLWDLHTGQALAPLAGHEARVRSVAFHPDNRRLISVSSDASIRVWDTVGLMPPIRLDGHSRSVATLAVGMKTGVVVSGSADQNVGIWDIERPSAPRFLKGHTGEVVSVAISRSEAFIASASADGTVRLWETASGKEIGMIEPKAGGLDAIAISPDEKLIAVGGVDKSIRVYSIDDKRLVTTLTGHGGQVYSVAFSADGKQIVSAGFDTSVRLWNAENGRQTGMLAGHVGPVFSAGYLPDQRLIASASEDGSVILWDVEKRAPRLTMLSLRVSEDWLVATPEGFFDGSQNAQQRILWRFENDTFNVRPVEEFFNEFYLPGLLSELLNGRKLPPDTDISRKDRRQPTVKISLPDVKQGTAVSERSVKVRIDISRAPAGAKDVRLFRNGTLARIWRNDVLGGLPTKTLETEVPIVAGENRFSAYAFNRDDIKSRDDLVTVTGAENLRRKGVMYILSIGVNKYANADYDLTNAVNDANEFADEFTSQQNRIGAYEKVEVMSLLDDKATKPGILAALATLAEKVQPEDALVVFYAGHGVAEQKRFYLIGHDIGYRGLRADVGPGSIDQIVANGVSDLDLEKSVENIRAEQFLLVIDACNSGQAIETEDMRRGPMNSKGLAQLAYEKGMYILTASQGFQAAKEDARLGNGYLTYALIEDGLRASAADRQPKDGRIMLREWLNYAADRVPQIDREESEKAEKRTRGIKRAEAKAAGQRDAEGLQLPRVFYRREREVRPLVVATAK